MISELNLIMNHQFDFNNIEYQHSLDIVIELLNRHAHLQSKYVRANEKKSNNDYRRD